MKGLPLVKENHFREHLNKADIPKSMEPDRLHPQVLRELADVTVRPLLDYLCKGMLPEG